VSTAEPPWRQGPSNRHARPVGFLRHLDDRVIGKAERDPATRRRVDAWANAVLILIGGGLAIAVYVSDRKSELHSPGIYLLIGAVIGGALLRIGRSRSR
jgi:hypothetical protein